MLLFLSSLGGYSEVAPVFFLILLFILGFFYHRLSSAFDFSMSKDFSINKEFPRVNFVKCAM